MKVGILTFHRADNYGAVLQVYALYTQCVTMGYDTEVIDYRCNAIENAYLKNKFPKLRKNVYRWSLDVVNYLRFGRAWIEKRTKFDSFRELFSMSNPHYISSDKCKVEEEYDCIITGSDQIWNTDILNNKLDEWYCYRRETSSKVGVISYAASVGSLPHFEERFSEFQSVLNGYNAISVRENEVQAFLEEKLNRKVHTVLDPTLLVDKQLWLSLISERSIQNGKYLVYYDVEQNALSRQVAGDIARQGKYTVVMFNLIKSPRFDTRYLSDAGPLDFLNGIYGAECIVTSSFHATVFSILFQKKFIAVLHPMTGERIRTLLLTLGLEDRIVYESNENIMEIMNQPIDYVSVELKLIELKESSVKFLRDALGIGRE